MELPFQLFVFVGGGQVKASFVEGNVCDGRSTKTFMDKLCRSLDHIKRIQEQRVSVGYVSPWAFVIM